MKIAMLSPIVRRTPPRDYDPWEVSVSLCLRPRTWKPEEDPRR
jgi:hypothetical protein